jgi:tetratricopeptide (TPR) repeat protein
MQAGLTEYERTVCAHAQYFCDHLTLHSRHLQGGGTPDGGLAQQAAINILNLEHDNLYEALDSAFERRAIQWLLPMAKCLRILHYVQRAPRLQLETYGRLLDAALTVGDAALELQAQLGISVASMWLGQHAGARGHAETARDLAQELGETAGSAAALQFLGVLEFANGNHDKARATLEESLAYRRSTADRPGEATALYILGDLYQITGNNDMALQLYTEAQAVNRAHGNALGEAHLLNKFGNFENRQGNYPAAGAHYAEALVIQRRIGDTCGEGYTLGDLGAMEYAAGNFGAALPLLEQALAIHRMQGDRTGEALASVNIANVAYMHGHYAAACGQFAQSLGIWLEAGTRFEMTIGCAMAGAALVMLGQLRPGALALYGGLDYAKQQGYLCDPADRRTIDSGLARLDAAVGSGEITAAELEAWKSEAAALELEAIGALTLDALRNASSG